MYWRVLNQNSRVGLELTFKDSGPGIPDVERAMEPGFTTGKGLGMGLPGSKRLMDEMTIESTVGKGTTVVVRKWLKK
jgi:serine/threonine-protein kinase RsbT